jgi:hypothetical protein
MSKSLGNQLTESLVQRLSGKDVSSYEGKIIPIFTIDEGGWPHPALLSYYEVVAKNPSTLDMALWKDSSTARNLRSSGRVTLMISDVGVNYYIKGTVEELERELAGAPQVSRFRITPTELLEDQEPNAEITSGLTYRRGTERAAADFSDKVFKLLCERS